MAYLQESDYTLRIDQVTLEEILTQASSTSGLSNTQVRQNAETWAQAVIISFLTSKYQIAVEFAKTAPDATRSYLIMSCMLDLAIWTLHKTVNPRDIPELREKCYQDAMAWLDDARAVRFVLPGIGLISGYFNMQVGSGAKFVSDPFKEARTYDTVLNSPIPPTNQ